MKKSVRFLYLIFFLSVLSISNILKSQTKIEDKAMVEMAERMVYKSWTFEYPKEKKYWFIRLPLWRTILWRWNSHNRRYKRGRDIRPLKVSGGDQSLRYLLLLAQEEETKKIKDEVDELAITTAKEFAHWSSRVVELDPLWKTYYKNKLTDIKNFPEEPEDYKEWGFNNEVIYDKLKDIGALDYLHERLDLLKNKFKISRKTDMPRGKRIMIYDEIMREWEEFASELKEYEEVGQTLIYIEEAKNKKINIKRSKTDKEIMEDVMREYKDKF